MGKPSLGLFHKTRLLFLSLLFSSNYSLLLTKPRRMSQLKHLIGGRLPARSTSIASDACVEPWLGSVTAVANGCAFGSCITMIGAFPFSELLPDDFPNLEPAWELGCKRHDSACSWRYCQFGFTAFDVQNNRTNKGLGILHSPIKHLRWGELG